MPHKDKKMIEINNLNKKFQKNEVLKNLNIKIEKGESAVIIGRSGTGKSVLLKCLLGLLKPDNGKIKIGDKYIHGKNYEYIGNKEVKIGMLFQGGALFDSLNIWRNISFSALQNKISEKECKKIAIETLEKVGLNSNVADLYPSELSGGMQKRVSLGRAIFSEPDIIFFDEPTTGLDPITADVINKLILEKVNDLGATALTITHDMSSARTIASKVYMLHEGNIIWGDSVNEMEKTKNEYILQFVNGQSKGPIKIQNN